MPDITRSIIDRLEKLAVRVRKLETQVMSMGSSYGWINGAWQKNPLLFGYSGEKEIAVSNTSLAAGANDLDSTAVPAGEIWVITHVAMSYVGTAPTHIEAKTVGASAIMLFRQLAPVTTVVYDRQGWWIMEEGDLLRCTVAGATLNDDLYLWATGFKVDIDQ